MDKSKRQKISDEEANKILEEILTEDKLSNGDGTEDDAEDDESDESTPCTAKCAQEGVTVKQKFCECIRMAENSSRFSLRVMEAMRGLQYDGDTMMPTCSAEDIVSYIQANYRDDGDLYAQVRTALKQVCSQGFVMELLKNEYHLIGPDAITMNQVTCPNEQRSRSSAQPTKSQRRRKNDNDEEDACGCDTSSEDETPQNGQGRRQSIRESERMPGNHRSEHANDVEVEEAAGCSCSANLTEDECTCNNRAKKNVSDALTERMFEDPRSRGDTSVSGERQGIFTSAATSRRKSNRERRGTARTEGAKMQKNSNDSNRSLSQFVDDVYRELEEQNPGITKQNEKELRQWIKRCQEECLQRKRRRDTDN